MLAYFLVSHALILLTECQDQQDARRELQATKSWQETARPDQRHHDLTELAGQWRADLTLWTNPALPATEASGNAKIESLLGGRFIEIEMDAVINTVEFRSILILGFDSLREVYSASVMDTTSTSQNHFTGQLNKTGRTIVLRGEVMDPLTALPLKVRIEFYIFDKNKFETTTFLELATGQELKAVHVDYARYAIETE